MARIDDVYPSKWLRASDLRGQARTFTIKDAEIGTVGEKSQIVVNFHETDKPFGLNKTNAQAIAGVYGDDTDDWINEQVALFPTKVDFQGQIVDAIRVDEKQTRTIIQNKLKAEKAAKAGARAGSVKKESVLQPMTQAEIDAEIGPEVDDIPF